MSRVAMIGVVAAILFVLILGFYFLPPLTETSLSLEPARGSAASIDLGVTYLPLTPRLSAYYDLGVDSGALVTGVAPNSPADRAGGRGGDVIRSFNGASVEKERALLGMIRACPADSDVVLEVCRGKRSQIIELVLSCINPRNDV